MQMIFYNITVRMYWIVILALSPFYPRAKKFVRGRRKDTFKKLLPKSGKKRIWMHVSSLGEFEQGRPLIEKIRSSFPEVEIVLSFFSPSGYEVRKNYDKVDHVLYMPMDFPAKARLFLSKIDPDLIVIVKYEFWLHHLKQAFRESIPVVYLAAIFNEKQVYFNRGKNLYLPVFKKIDHFFVQNEYSKNILQKHHISQVTVSGDTRFDRVIEIAEGAKKIKEVDEFLDNKKCFVFGSIWNSDLDSIAAFIHEIKHQYKIIIAPHNVDEDNIHEILEEFPSAIRFSEWAGTSSSDILLIDNMGMLSSLYAYARYAFIGGAFRGALHNTIEAAVYGIPVFFGEHRNNRKFSEAVELINGGGAFTFNELDQLRSQFKHLEKNENTYQKASAFCRNFVLANKGATGVAFDYLKKFFE